MAMSPRWYPARRYSSTASTPARRQEGWSAQASPRRGAPLPRPIGPVARAARVAHDFDLRRHGVCVASLGELRQLGRGVGQVLGVLTEAGTVAPDRRQSLGLVALVAAGLEQRCELSG